MNNNKFLEKLQDMKGKTFQYGNTIYYVIDFKIDEEEDKCTLQTNLNTFDRKLEAMNEFLKYWHPVNSLPALLTETEQDNKMTVFMDEGNALSNRLIDILNDNIEKVQNDKDYIPQAQTINNNINSIVNIAKMRFDFLKQVNAPLQHSKKMKTA